MGSSYIKLTNDLLRRINEVELTGASFNSARGIQAVAKDCVLDSIREINQQRWQWPFHAVQHTLVLQVGINEYAWPSNFKSVDWNSFQIIKDSVNVTNNQQLKLINREEWYRKLRDTDDDKSPDGISRPAYVFRAHGNGFGVSPAPDKEYTVEFRYFKVPDQMVEFDDVTTIPSEYDNVILWGGLYNMNLFRENEAGTSIAKKNFDDGIEAMYNIFIETVSESLTDRRVNFGGHVGSYSRGGYHV